MALNSLHILGIVLTLVLITCVGIYSGRKVKNAADFSTGGGKTGAAIVSGTIMGTLVGGASTIGTAQLAFTNGFSAWWFTLGGGIGCLIQALIFVKPLRRAKAGTIQGIVSDEFGERVGILASVLAAVGTFLNIIAQLISATALISTMFPVNFLVSAIAAVALMAVYVIFGGVWGTGLVGVVKLILLYIAVIAGGVLALNLSGGIGALYSNEALGHSQYWNLFSRGVGIDAGAGLSLLFGVLSTQTYAQAVMSAKSDKTARKGSLISAILIPPIGIGGILIGMYMRLNYMTTSEIAALAEAGQSVPAGMMELASAKQAFPQFIIDNMPPLIAGIFLATLLIATVGTGAGLSLGISTIIQKDILGRRKNAVANPKRDLTVGRVLIVAILVLAACMSTGALGDIILEFSFMSMGIRGAAIFIPLCAALFLPGRVDRKFALAAIIAGPLVVFVGNFFITSFDPLLIGMAAALVIMLAGIRKKPQLSDRAV